MWGTRGTEQPFRCLDYLYFVYTKKPAISSAQLNIWGNSAFPQYNLIVMK